MAKRVVGFAAGLVAASRARAVAGALARGRCAVTGRPVGAASRSEADVRGVVSGTESAELVLG